MINTIIQILLSVFLIAIMAFISYSVYNNEYISSISLTTSNKKATRIFSGIIDFTKDKNISFETFDKYDLTYLDINPSINQNGGAEYSYNFWLYFDVDNTSGTITNNINAHTPNDAGFSIPSSINEKKYKYLILFYKGEKQEMPIKEPALKYDCDYKTKLFDEQILIKNPLVKIRNDAKEIVIDYNNINYPESYNTAANIIDCNNDDEVLKKRNINKFGIKNIDVDKYKKQFNMITIVFQEQPKYEYLFYKNNTNCKVYFNKHLIADRLANSDNIELNTIDNFKSRVMKSNFSKLHINPLDSSSRSGGITGYSKLVQTDNVTESTPLQLADLTYYNYALTQNEINKLYNMGFTKYAAEFKKPLENTIFNKATYIKNLDTSTTQI
jgi:hypothetical protein